jgi:hypothetical protein
MKGLGRKLFNLAAAGSVLFAAVMSLWIRSYWAGDMVIRSVALTGADSGARRSWFVRSNLGWLYFGSNVSSVDPRERVESGWRHETHTPISGFTRIAAPDNLNKPGTGVRAYGFNIYIVGFLHMQSTPRQAGDKRPRTAHIGVVVPHWILGMAFTLPLVARLGVGALRRRRTRFALARNLCVSCGYDLRATPDRCPECGTVVNRAEGGRMKDDAKAEGIAQ